LFFLHPISIKDNIVVVRLCTQISNKKLEQLSNISFSPYYTNSTYLMVLFYSLYISCTMRKSANNTKLRTSGWMSPLPHPLPLAPPTFPTSLSLPVAPPPQWPPSSPKAPVSSPSLSPLAQPFWSASRSKEACWSDASPASSTPVSPHSFRDVVASSVPPCRETKAVILSKKQEPLRIKLKPQARRARLTAPVDAPDGWQTVKSCATRKREARALSWRRPMLVDLCGRCFNCFSENHHACHCRSHPRCFRCRRVGHCSYSCLRPTMKGVLVSRGGSRRPLRGRKRCLPCTRPLLFLRAHSQRLLQGIALLCGTVSLRRA
jgi:hypothetical protein